MNACPLCLGPVQLYSTVRGSDYFECCHCDFISLSTEALDAIDAGNTIRNFDQNYWKDEMWPARERSFGPSLSRFAELMLYARIPVHRFLDIGSGTGHYLDALSFLMPSSKNRFYGVEPFPPEKQYRTRHPNFMVGRVSDVPGPFQAGTCIEVIEHLTPRMVENLARDLAKCTVPGSIFLFNTGLTDFVKQEDPGYLDPDGRGHISIWSVTAARHIFSQYGFSVYPLRAKNWAFIVERNFPEQDIHSINMDERIWTHLKANEAVLRDPVTTDVMYYLGMDAARAH